MYKKIDYRYADTVREVVDDPYDSSRQLVFSVSEIVALLVSYGLTALTTDGATPTPANRYWPGDKEERFTS